MIAIDLSGKRAFVCGSTQGIGRAIAVALASAGASVTLAARNAEALRRVASELPASGGQRHDFVAADFGDYAAATNAVAEYLSAEADEVFHILVNNTGGPPPGAIAEASAGDFERAFSQHLLMSHFLVQRLSGGMKRATYGRVINVVSTSVKQPIPNLGVSNAARGAMASWAKTLSFELAPFGVTVNNILPGYVSTGRLAALAESVARSQNRSPQEVEQSMLQTVPAGRFGEPAEAGYLAAFLASPLAAYVTGASVALDGGRTSAL